MEIDCSYKHCIAGVRKSRRLRGAAGAVPRSRFLGVAGCGGLIDAEFVASVPHVERGHEI